MKRRRMAWIAERGPDGMVAALRWAGPTYDADLDAEAMTRLLSDHPDMADLPPAAVKATATYQAIRVGIAAASR